MRVEEEGKTCYFKCMSNTCTAMDTAIRDQVIIGTTDSEIRKQALLKGRDLGQLKVEGRRIEAAEIGEKTISTKTQFSNTVYKSGLPGPYSRKFNSAQNLKRNNMNGNIKYSNGVCYRCGGKWFQGHAKQCPANGKICESCKNSGHFSKMCKKKK